MSSQEEQKFLENSKRIRRGRSPEAHRTLVQVKYGCVSEENDPAIKKIPTRMWVDLARQIDLSTTQRSSNLEQLSTETAAASTSASVNATASAAAATTASSTSTHGRAKRTLNTDIPKQMNSVFFPQRYTTQANSQPPPANFQPPPTNSQPPVANLEAQSVAIRRPEMPNKVRRCLHGSRIIFTQDRGLPEPMDVDSD